MCFQIIQRRHKRTGALPHGVPEAILPAVGHTWPEDPVEPGPAVPRPHHPQTSPLSWPLLHAGMSINNSTIANVNLLGGPVQSP